MSSRSAARGVAAALVAATLSACLSNPDPRSPTTLEVQQQSLGGWVVVTPRQGPRVSGELISVDAYNLALLTVAPKYGGQPRELHLIPIAAIQKAELFRYESNDTNLGTWGIVGTLSTISHGIFLALSAPVWVVSSSIAGVSESRHIRLTYPDDPLAELAKWARFPQGMPPGLDPRALVEPVPAAGPASASTPAPAVPAPSAPATTPAAKVPAASP